MREIKFRAWDNVDFKMYYTGEEDNIHFYFDSSGIVAERFTDIQVAVEDRLEDDVHVEKLEHLQYMEYTGLKDKNGKEIYEGDVVRIVGEQELDGGYNFSWNHNSVVRWDESECGFYLDVIKKYQATICQDGFYTVDTFPLRKWSEEEWWIEYEVIGNIYENPELIK